MRNFIFGILYLGFSACLFSCSKTEKEDAAEDDRAFTVEAYYTVSENQDLHPDAGAAVYLYYDLYSMDLANSRYSGEGQFLKQDSLISPAEKYYINSEGKAILHPDNDRKITIVAESNYYKDRIAVSSYEKFEKSMSCTNLFKP